MTISYDENKRDILTSIEYYFTSFMSASQDLYL